MKKIIVALIIPCLLIIFVQMGLANPRTREMFTKIDNYEKSEIIKAKEKRKYVVLSLTQGLPSDSITVYANSNPVIRFSGREIKVPMECPCILEVRNDTNSVVKINAQSEDCNIEVLNTIFPRGIKSLCRIS